MVGRKINKQIYIQVYIIISPLPQQYCPTASLWQLAQYLPVGWPTLYPIYIYIYIYIYITYRQSSSPRSHALFDLSADLHSSRCHSKTAAEKGILYVRSRRSYPFQHPLFNTKLIFFGYIIKNTGYPINKINICKYTSKGKYYCIIVIVSQLSYIIKHFSSCHITTRLQYHTFQQFVSVYSIMPVTRLKNLLSSSPQHNAW